MSKPSVNVTAAAAEVPERYYTHHPELGETVHRSNPEVIHRDLTALGVQRGQKVLEIGTGSGYSSGLLAALVGSTGHVTTVDVDPDLTQRAAKLHAGRGVSNVTCVAGDGTAGHRAGGPFDRIIAWCTPALLPATWVEQLAPPG